MNLTVQISSNLSVSTHKLLVILVPNCFPFTGIHLRFNFQCTFPIYSLVAFAMWVNCQRVSQERRTTYHRKYERWGCLKLCRAHKPRGNTHTKRKATFKHVRILLCIIYSVYVYIVKCLSSFVFNKHNFEVLLLLFSIYNCLNFSIPTVRLPIPSQFTVVFFFFFHLQSFSFIFFLFSFRCVGVFVFLTLFLHFSKHVVLFHLFRCPVIQKFSFFFEPRKLFHASKNNLLSEDAVLRLWNLHKWNFYSRRKGERGGWKRPRKRYGKAVIQTWNV